jgi:hypothetical protein
MRAMDCRFGCGACCISPSISSAIPGMPSGKPAGEPCVQLDAEHRCRLFGSSDRPTACVAFTPYEEVCGQNREQALSRLAWLERATTPGPIPERSRR